MKHSHGVVRTLAATLLVAGPTTGKANGALLAVSGTFAATPNSDVTSLSGSFVFTVDDSVIPDIGFWENSDISLTAFWLNPNPLGETAFDLTNVVAHMAFHDGTPTFLAVGGLSSGAGGLGSTRDDFGVWWGSESLYDVGAPTDVAVSIASESGTIGHDDSPSGSLTIVPEPSIPYMVLSSLLSLLSIRRHR